MADGVAIVVEDTREAAEHVLDERRERRVREIREALQVAEEQRADDTSRAGRWGGSVPCRGPLELDHRRRESTPAPRRDVDGSAGLPPGGKPVPHGELLNRAVEVLRPENRETHRELGRVAVEHVVAEIGVLGREVNGPRLLETPQKTCRPPPAARAAPR